jgi:hypothetical protein
MLNIQMVPIGYTMAVINGPTFFQLSHSREILNLVGVIVGCGWILLDVICENLDMMGYSWEMVYNGY